MKSTWEEKQVNKVEQIFQDENHTCEFNFTKAQWAIDGLHNIYGQAKAGLSDVDYLFETEKEILHNIKMSLNFLSQLICTSTIN